LLSYTPALPLKRLALTKSKLSPEMIRLLANAPACHALEMLDLDSTRIRAKGAAELGRGSLNSLRSLQLRNCWIEDAGLEALVDSPLLERLFDLNLRSNKLSDRAMVALAGGKAGNLNKLNVNNNLVTPAGSAALWDSPNLSSCRIFTEHKKQKKR